LAPEKGRKYMLDQLVESKTHSTENKRRSEIILIVGTLAVLSLLTTWTVSLFGKDFGMGSDDLSLTTLVAPVPVPEEEPPPEPEKQPEQKQPDVDVRKELIQNIMSSPVKPPDEISTKQNTVKAMRTDRITMIGTNDSDTGARVDSGVARVVDSGGTGGLSTGSGTATTGGEEEAAPPPKVAATPKPVPKMVSQVKAGGAVSVQVVISEGGSVISASAVSGHPLLRAAAESAARGARFSPTLLSGQPVKVSGVITYNFVP
jgi:protein TonB